MLDTTIAAIATPIGHGGISIIRISGSESLDILKKIFKSNNNELKSHRLYYGHIVDNESVIDEVMVSYMKAPRSFTREDVVEINCHGGIKCTNRILNLVLKNGAVIADAGEFTKRAFLNGRIDLSQAEAVIDIINSNNDKAIDVAVSNLNGNISELINNFRERILLLIANIEASIDYPEHEEEFDNKKSVLEVVSRLKLEIEKLIKSFNDGKIISNGVKTVILGVPNSGKSSLLNYMLGEERAIVTHIEGTTRDVLSEEINFNNITLKIYDTAGIRESDDIIEKIGIDKAIKYADEADLILYVIDSNKEITKTEAEFIQALENGNKKIIYIFNKIDLERKISNDFINAKEFSVKVSTINKIGLDNLKDLIFNIFIEHDFKTSDIIITKERHYNILMQVQSCLDNCLMNVDILTEDLLSIDLTNAFTLLGEILGLDTSEDIIDKIFSEFCLGK